MSLLARSPGPTSVRSKARPPRPTRDAARTQTAILEAATQEFARHGLGGARVDRIADRAKTNKRMLYYYFGGKEDLFLAVLERAYEHIRGEEQQLHLTNLPPVAGNRLDAGLIEEGEVMLLASGSLYPDGPAFLVDRQQHAAVGADVPEGHPAVSLEDDAFLAV